MATNGLVLIKPSTVDKTGASSTATINTGGSVTFSLCETLSLNGVFSSAYDNYIIDMRFTTAKTSKNPLTIRLRLSGQDNSTASSYVSQLLRADATTVSGSRTTADYGLVGGYETDVAGEGLEIFVYGPALAQPTAWRGVGVNADTSAGIDDYAGTHNQSTGYDGLTVRGGVDGSDAVSGLIKVYGLVK